MDDDIVPVSQFTTPLSLSTSDSQMSSEVVKQQEDVTIQPISDKNYKVDMERPIIISPNKISSRSFDQGQFLTPSSSSNSLQNMEKVASCDKIVARSLQFSPSLSPCEASQSPPPVPTVPTTPPPSPGQETLLEGTGSTSETDEIPSSGMYQALTRIWSGHGRGVSKMPRQSIRPGITRQPTPDTKPLLRPTAPRLLRTPRQEISRNLAAVHGP